MDIIVCIKQVPGTTKVDIDPETGVLKRDGIESKMNPYDLAALETAFHIRERAGGTVTVLSMGPPQAQSIIREAYMMGADRGYLLTDRRFAGSDVLATSRTLAQGIRSVGQYDLILCGKQTTDGDTAQVGPAIAEHLGIPHVTWVRAIEAVTDRGITVEQNMEDSYEVVRLPFPCLLSVEKDIYTPRLPSYRRRLETQDRPIHCLSLAELPDKDESHYGLQGSPTQVERIFTPETFVAQVIWDGEPVENAARLCRMLAEQKFVEVG